jgi:hypothetical protein
MTTPWTDEERALRRDLEAGTTVVINMKRHPNVVRWAREQGLLQRIDRRTVWGNPFKLGQDGDRREVIDSYAQYLAGTASLIDRLGELRGKALACWCAPEPCHGDVLLDAIYGSERFPVGS